MFVSQNHIGEPGSDRAAAVAWLERQVAWEKVLGRLRREAGVDSEATPEVPAAA